MARARYGDRFEVLELLGQGGVGKVYRALDLELNREVALKVVSRERGDASLKRFRREGELTAALRHPGVVRVHSFGYEGDEAYLAYELISGAKTLRDAMQELDREAALKLLAEAAAALGHAHEEGVTHRDIKPENILVTAGGEPKIADFGLAAAQGQERLTQTGMLVGTPFYMAPEQFAQGRAVGPETDVWALGVILYELLSGELPFQGGTLLELGALVMRSDLRPPGEAGQRVPVDLEAICLKALRREPAERYPNAGAFAGDLRRFLAGEGVSAETTRWRPPRLSLRPLAACGALTSVALLLGLALRTAPDAAVVEPAALSEEAVGTVTRIRCGWRLEAGGEITDVELTFDERVTGVEAGSTTLEATLRAARLRLVGDVPLAYDTGADHWLPLDRAIGRTWSCTLSPELGTVGELVGLGSLRDEIVGAMSGAAPPVRRLVGEALDEVQLRRHLASVLALAVADPTGGRRFEVWPSRDLGLECTVSAKRLGNELSGRLTSWSLLEGPLGSKVREPEVAFEASLRDARVRSAKIELSWRASSREASEQVSFRLRYEATPEPGARPDAESDSHQ